MMPDVETLLRRIGLRRAEESPPDDELFYNLIKSKPKKVVWVTEPRQRWAIAYNPSTVYKTTSDVFSSTFAFYNYPIGVSEMTVPKKFLASDVFARIGLSLEWPGADLRPERKYRNLRRPGVVEVIY